MTRPLPYSRRAFVAAAAAAAVGSTGRRVPLVGGGWDSRSLLAPRPTPSASQLEWQRDGLAMFCHFGVNTFTDREWGDGTEDPAIFAPAQLDTRLWARAARAGGCRTMILTAKHHDGFCLWPTKTTTHSVARSPWKQGAGDVVREFVDACRAEGLKAGLYLSPWDRHEPSYGDSARYNDLYCDQLTELLTQYGPIHEVWFDGANGEGPNGKRQVYDWPRTWALVRRLQPRAVIFSDAGPDIRWIGNERGAAAETNWSTIDPASVPYPGAPGDAVIRALQRGDPNGSVWRPGETDVSIRPGWFHHPAEDARVKTVNELVDLYFTSVGRNSKLLLNVPPTRDGRLHDTDVARLERMRSALATIFMDDLVGRGHRVDWRGTGPVSAAGEIDFVDPVDVGLVDLREDIARGQLVVSYTVEGTIDGEWHELSRGSTIGHRKLDRFKPVPISRFRLRIDEALAEPHPLQIALYSGA